MREDTLCNRVIVDSRLIGAVQDVHIFYNSKREMVTKITKVCISDPNKTEVIRKTDDHILVIVGDLAKKVMRMVDDAMSEED